MTYRSWVLYIGCLTLTLLNSAISQNNVTIHAESVPSLTAVRASIRLRNLSNSNEYSGWTDSTSGNLQLNVPNGTYEIRSGANNHFVHVDTIIVSGTTNVNRQLIENLPVNFTYYTNNLEMVKLLTATHNPEVNRFLRRQADGPERLYARNYNPNDSLSMPQNFRAGLDSVLSDIARKSQGLLRFREEQTDTIGGNNLIYPRSQAMPLPGALGYTEIAVQGYEIIATLMYINRESNNSNNVILAFFREFFRAQGFQALSQDPSSILYFSGTGSWSVPPDDALLLRITRALKNGSDMSKHKDSLFTTGVNTDYLIPQSYSLGNYPNPFNPTTTISYSLPSISNVTITVYNTLGQQVSTLVNEREEPGTYQTTFNAEGLASGVYLVRLNAVSATWSVSITRSMVLIK